MKYVYLLQSIDHPEQTYVGLADDLHTRLASHNAGQSLHTKKFKPWRLVTYVAFADEPKRLRLRIHEDRFRPSLCQKRLF